MLKYTLLTKTIKYDIITYVKKLSMAYNKGDIYE